MNQKFVKIRTVLVICNLVVSLVSFAQQPRYTPKRFVTLDDTMEFKRVYPPKTGFQKAYIFAHPQVWDLDDDSTTFIMGGVSALLCFEGYLKNGKREGVFTVFVIDSLDHSKRYKIWEQTYSNDKLNGQWKTYTLRGTQANFQTFKNDSLDGITRNFWIDGKTIIEENEYSDGHNKHIHRLFFDNGKIKAEIPYKDDSINGIRKKYYENGTLQEVAEFRKGHFDGVRKYYYPNGQIWIEQIYRAGKSWTVVANYTDIGQRRDPGTLRDGNGTLILYNEDGTVRETTTFVNGEERSSR